MFSYKQNYMLAMRSKSPLCTVCFKVNFVKHDDFTLQHLK